MRAVQLAVLHQEVGDVTASVLPLGEVERRLGAVARDELELRGRFRGAALRACLHHL